MMERSLTIRRVATVLSNYQENTSSCEDPNSKAQGCASNCLGNCSLPVCNLPVYVFKSCDHDCTGARIPGPCNGGCFRVSHLSSLLLGQWEERMSRGLFRYDVTSCETKVIPGEYGFVAQLNEGRHLKKRPTEFCIDKVLQPFDKNKFNFTKVGLEEILFRFEQCQDVSPGDDVEEVSPTVVAINVSPIEYGHVLLIPRVLDLLPQEMDCSSLLIALHFAKEASDLFFRVGYNSLGAFATINHLHFQAYYLQVPFPIEKAPTCRIMSSKGPFETRVVVSELQNYPLQSLVFEGGSKLQDLCDAVSSSCISLQNKNIAFNLLITDSGKRVFLLPQCYAEKQARGEVNQELLDTQVNPAVWEISGHIVLKRRKDYDEASEQYAWRLLSEVSLSDERFQQFKELVRDASNLLQSQQLESSPDSSTPKVASHLPQDCVVLH